MTLAGELQSLRVPSQPTLSRIPSIGEEAPVSEELQLPQGRATIITFLRHCGCPFSEKTFRDLHSLAIAHPEISFVAVSHSNKTDTVAWVTSLPLPEGPESSNSNNLPPNLTVVVDEGREIYARWGLGLSSYWEVFSPWSTVGAAKLGWQGIWNRPTNSGYRLQRAGSFAVDKEGRVVWVHVSWGASDTSDFDKAMQSLMGEEHQLFRD